MSLINLPSVQIAITPTITAGAYATGDQIGPKATALANASLERGSAVILESLLAISGADIAPDLDFLFWSRDPSAGISSADNDAFAVTDAELAASFLGKVSIVAADWLDTGGNRVANKDSIGKLLRPDVSRPDLNSTGRKLYVTVVAGAAVAPTFGATTDLTVRFGFMQH